MPSVIQFPEDLMTNPDYAGNYILFSAKNISGGVDTRTLKFTDAGGVGALSVALPIPQGLNTAYQNQWDQLGVNALTSAGTKMSGGIMGAIDRVVSKQSLTGMAAQAATEVGKVAGGLSMPEMKDVPPSLRAANQAGAGVVKEMTAAAMTAPALGAVVEAAQFSIGRRALQQTMISYGGPGFRSFDWSFSMKPLSFVETGAADAIVNYFKVRSMPNQTEMEHTRVYNLPDVFKVQLFSNFHEAPWLFKIGHCACTNVGVTYGGDKFTTFDTTHAPVQKDLQLQFREMELLNRSAVAGEFASGSQWPQSAWGSAENDSTSGSWS